MRIDIIQKGRVCRSIHHDGKTYVQAPKKGKYTIRITNTWKRQLAVLSVDGINVLNGEDAGHSGPGYVLSPYETFDIPGFRRSDGKAAAFRFKEQGESYAAQTGKGTNNVGVIGLAVFEEKVVVKVPAPYTVHHHHHNIWPSPSASPVWLGTRLGANGPGIASTHTTISASTGEASVNSVFMADSSEGQSYGGEGSTSGGTLRSSSPKTRSRGKKGGPAGSGILRRARKGQQANKAEITDVGTAYGEEVTFHTEDTEFTRASDSPIFVAVLRYATLGRLKSWGVPIDDAPAAREKAPNPFPASVAGVPAPPGWQG